MASPDIHMQKTSVYTRWRGAFVFFPRGTAYLRSSRRLARTARLAVVDNSLSIRGLYLRHRARRPRCFGRLSVNWRVPEKKLMFCPFYSCLVHLLFETVGSSEEKCSQTSMSTDWFLRSTNHNSVFFLRWLHGDGPFNHYYG